MKYKTVRATGLGGYVEVFRHEGVGQKPLLDLCFFEGNRTISEAKRLRDALSKAIVEAEKLASR